VIHGGTYAHRSSRSGARYLKADYLHVELCKPGQPAPYSQFPFIALAILVAAGVIAGFVVQRHPRTGAGEGAAFSGT
jgi:hypothetical protein